MDGQTEILAHSIMPQFTMLCGKKDPQLSQRDRGAGCLISFGQKWKTWTRRQYFTDIIGLPSTTAT